MTTSALTLDDFLEREWYLDTSLFADFLQSRAPVAIKNAEQHDGVTIAKIQAGSPAGVYTPVLMGERRVQFRMTRNLHWLHMLAWILKPRYLYSEVVKSEVIRQLRLGHSEASAEEVLEWWGVLSGLLKDFQQIPFAFGDAAAISELALAFPIKKNIQDYMHLVLAAERGAIFVTSDRMNGHLAGLARDFYARIAYWPHAKETLLAHPKVAEILGNGEREGA